MSVSRPEVVLASVKDLTPSARIRNAALELFATRGVKGTSVRAVAAAAGVSPGLVQHYYPTKTALREAVDGYVLDVTMRTYAGVPSQDTSSADRVEEIGKRVTALFRDRPTGHRYVARGLVDGDDWALQMFDALVQLVGGLVSEDIAAGRISDQTDAIWAALHPLVFHFGVVLLEHAIDRQLPEPLRSDEGLARWGRATGALYRHGLYRSET